MPDDSTLLDRYARFRAEEAFTELVRRHLGLVYSVALRQVGRDAHLAEEVTQRVFADVARKASALTRHPVLSAWLYRSTRYTAIDAVRAEQRRRRREQISLAMQETSSPSHAGASIGDEVRPLLDEAMADLPERDRTAIMLRFFEECPLAELGRRLRITEDAARMRVDRAMDRLRAQLAARGVTSTAAALGAALAGQASVIPPTGLAAAIASAAALTSAGGVTVTTGFLGFMSTTKTILCGIGLAVLLGGGVAWFVSRRATERVQTPPQFVPTSNTSSNDTQMTAAPLSPTPGRTPAGPTSRPEPPRDFASEFAQLVARPDSPERKEQLRVLLTAWGKVAPRDARAAVSGLGLKAAEQEFYEIDLFAGWAVLDPEAAWAAAPKLSTLGALGLATRADNLILQKIARVLAESGQTELALRLIAGTPDEAVRDGTFNSLIPILVKSDFPGVLARIATMQPDGSARLNAVTKVSRALAQEFPDLAADYAMKLDPTPIYVRSEAIRAVFEEFGRNGHARLAAEWIARAPDEALRDHALRSYLGIKGTLTPQARDEALKKLQAAAAN